MLMKIAYLSRGNSVYDRRFLEKMVERGHQPHFISYYPCEHVQVAGVRNYFYDYFSMNRFNRLVSLQTSRHLRRLLHQIQPDILHTGWVQDHGFFGALCGFHPVLSMPWGSDILIQPHDSIFGKWITRFTLKKADMITCDCQVVKNKIVELSGCRPDKIVVFPWGIDLETFRPECSNQIRKKLGWEHKKILICTRNFDIRAHAVEYFIMAIPAILERCPDVRVILVGAGPLEHEYRELVSKLGLDDAVHFAGWLNEVQMAEHLNAADVYVSTSLSDGTSASLLEAMACGLPVVVSDAPANLEWVKDGDNGYIVPRKKPDILAERIITLLANESLRREMRARNLKIAQEKADWNKNFTVLENTYHKLCKTPKIPKDGPCVCC